MNTHTEKWREVCQELEQKHPASNVTLWVNGYVTGLLHAADMACRSQSGVDAVKTQCTATLLHASRDGREIEKLNSD